MVNSASRTDEGISAFLMAHGRDRPVARIDDGIRRQRPEDSFDACLEHLYAVVVTSTTAWGKVI